MYAENADKNKTTDGHRYTQIRIGFFICADPVFIGGLNIEIYGIVNTGVDTCRIDGVSIHPDKKKRRRGV